MAANKAFELAIKIGGEILPSLKRATENAQKQISTLSQAVSRDLDGAARKAEKAMKRVTDNRAWRTAAVGATGFVGGVGLAVNEAVKWDTAMANVRKGLGDEGPKAMKKFSDAALKLSTEMPVPGEELLNIGSQFALAGEDVEDLIPLMKTAARMSVAFGMSGTEAADSMLALRASTGKSNEELVKLADAINHVSDNIKGKVSGGDLLQLTSDLAGVMNITSLTAEEFAGLGAAFLATGTPVERARTGLKNLLNAMQAGQSATKMQIEGIGMLFGGDAKAQADALAQRMVDDPKAAIADVIQRMSKLSAKEQPQALKMFVGEEGKAAIAPLLTNPELIREAMGLVANPMDYDGSMLREFENQAQSTSAQMRIFQNSIAAVGISIGSTLLPPLNKMMKAIHPFLQSFSQWAQKNQALVGTLTVLGLALSALILLAPGLAALGSLLGSLGAFMAGSTGIGALAGLAGSLGAVGPALAVFKAGGMIAGLKALGAAFVAITGPVGLTVLAIVGVGLALKALYDKVPAFRKFVDDSLKLLPAVGTAAKGAIDALGHHWKGFFAWFMGDMHTAEREWGMRNRQMEESFDQFTTHLITQFPEATMEIHSAAEALKHALKGEWDQAGTHWDTLMQRMHQHTQDNFKKIIDEAGIFGFKAGDSWGLNFVKALISRLANIGKTINDHVSGRLTDQLRRHDEQLRTRQGLPARMPRLTPSAADLPEGSWPAGVPRPNGARALGGAVNALRPILVGERGPEVFVPPASGRIVPHQDLLSLSQKLGLSGRALGGPVWRDQAVLTGERRAEVFMPSGVEDAMASRRQKVAAATGPSMVVNIGGIKIEGADTSNGAAIEAAVSEALRKAERRWVNRAGQRTRLLLND